MTKIKKYVLDSLTSSMYVDCRCIFREYIQNAADQIDIAREQNIDEDGYYDIHVRILRDKRQIIIEDTATGVKRNEKDVLLEVGGSPKKRGRRKGFRGIGRLGGIGYCKTMIFETSAKGEPYKTIITWDAAKMNTIVDDEMDDSEAGEVIEMCTSYDVQETEPLNTHYFRVILDDVTKDELLDVEDIKNYLSMVAPVDYPTSFMRFSSKIKRYTKENNLDLDVYNIFVGDDCGEDLLYKKYTTKILNKKDGDYDVQDIKFFSHTDKNGTLIYWGWYSISELKGQIQSYNPAYGMRLRCKNIQLGDAEACKAFFHAEGDKRFAQYFFGEVHVVSDKLLPDARRDYIKEGDARTYFEREVSKDFLVLKELCKDASDVRSAYKGILRATEGKERVEKKKSVGFVNKADQQKSDDDYKKFVQNKAKEEKRLETYKKRLEDKQSPLAPLFSSLSTISSQHETVSSGQSSLLFEPAVMSVAQGNPYSPRLRTDNAIYKKYSSEAKKVINVVYGVIYNTVVEESKRDGLINKIEKELTK